MNESQALVFDYFQEIANYSRGLMDRLPIPRNIQTIAETFSTLSPAFDSMRSEEVKVIHDIKRPSPAVFETDNRPAGMNTVGILADRLTILICKEWYLRNRQKNLARAEATRAQITEIAQSFCYLTRGEATLLEKVSSLPGAIEAKSFEESYFGLLEANILMWETQEILYMSQIDTVPAEELRDYIGFFSIANLKRNTYIKNCEELYWG